MAMYEGSLKTAAGRGRYYWLEAVAGVGLKLSNLDNFAGSH
jgi:hypothetical protein